ncbi:nuclear transport factor 2 family protein [Hyphomicrobium sp. CS1GBMeth3]|uniref:nuclear transport factor 2 family protein n=1 Tax=Hyphomicrobium sp. CS1GBMeth3 TaxID=1892845 RepID=UPI000931D1C7|nr:nuclear transport factor 2 family protein [Hyphomicrobium sp. CS1GBMeth3]
MKKLDECTALNILSATHDAWCRADIERLLSYYADDCVYWCNAGPLNGVPFVIEGKQALRTFLWSITSVAESRAVIEHFHFEDGLGRANVEAYLRHRRTGLVLAGSYRHIVTYRGRKIARSEQYHDAAKMAAFWQMVRCDEASEDRDLPASLDSAVIGVRAQGRERT